MKCEEDIYTARGFIDLQVNGFAGVDFNSPTATREEIARSTRALFSTGVTRFFPTVITGSPERMIAALANLAAARESLEDGFAMEAFHLEGPHISPEDGPRGAHPRPWVRPPDIEEFRRCQEAARGHVRLVTLSPEWPEATRYIEQIVRDGVVASIGHTRATSQQIGDAVSAGATLSTHLGNGANPTLPKTANYIWEQLAADRLSASFIVDGIHLPDAFLRAALRAKGISRSILVTDAVMPAMCAPGFYQLGEVEVELKADQRVVLRGGERLAGSSLRMDRAIENVIRIAGVSLEDAVAMATVNPARLLGIEEADLGNHADEVKFRFTNARIEVLETRFSGRVVFAK
jgi:N-acetylglucosamine-6-phosphate deacetylase